jgi:pimeloyl-ACP methyl ester carboxylesterase
VAFFAARVSGNQSLARLSAELGEPAELGQIPVIRLVAGRHVRSFSPAQHALWVQLQASETQAQANGRMQLVENSGHDIQIERPDVVVAAVKALLQSAPEDTPQLQPSSRTAPVPSSG